MKNNSETGRKTADEAILDIDRITSEFNKRYKLKKNINGIFNLVIFIFGISSLIYAEMIWNFNLILHMRYMTYTSTMFTTAVSLFTFLTCGFEAEKSTEVTSRAVYFLRLSAALTESVVMAVVLFGLTPLVEDVPDISTYTGVMMHLVIPPMTVLSFIYNEAPIGKLKWHEPLFGTWCITLYAVAMVIVFGTGILPSELAPYSFLDFEHHSIWYTLICAVVIYVVAYFIALLLSKLNMSGSWIWFKGIRPASKKKA